jgi:hypothetical protein
LTPSTGCPCEADTRGDESHHGAIFSHLRTKLRSLGVKAVGSWGFANVLWDGVVHTWIQDTMVVKSARRRGIAAALVGASRDGTRDASCEFLQGDFEDHLHDFHFGACGFKPMNGGLIELASTDS